MFLMCSIASNIIDFNFKINSNLKLRYINFSFKYNFYTEIYCLVQYSIQT